MPRPFFLLTRFPSEENPKPIFVARKEIKWESGAVFNPSVIYDKGKFVMLYRTYPDSLKEGQLRFYRPGYKLVNNISYIGLATSKNGTEFKRQVDPFITPDKPYDKFGCEDPRITKFEDYFYITYTAIDGPLWEKKKKPNVRIGLARTKDFKTVEKMGLIGLSAKSKAACIWPERVKGKIVFSYTVKPDSTNSSVRIKYFDKVEQILETKNWDDGVSLFKSEWWLHRGPELGAVPLKTKNGWLLIFSSEAMTNTWSVSAALFDLEKPDKMIGRTQGSILQPATDYERNGLVPNVVFPSGAIFVGDEVWIYYGAADTVIGLAQGKTETLIKALKI